MPDITPDIGAPKPAEAPNSVDLLGTFARETGQAPIAEPQAEEAIDLLDTFNRESQGIQTQREGAVRVVRDDALTIPPERAARIMNASIKSTLPDDIVSQNLEEIESEISKEGFDRKLSLNSPKLAEWLTKSAPRMAATVNDYQKLGKLEALLRRDPWLWPKPTEITDAEADAAGAAYVEPPPGPDSQFNSRAAFIARDKASRRREEAFISGDERVGFGEAIGARYDENPIFYLPFMATLPDVGRGAAMYNAVKAFEAGTATTLQTDFLVRAARLEAAANMRGKSVMGTVGSILAELPAFAGEFAATGGFYALGKEAALEATKGVAKTWLKQTLRKALSASVGAAAQTAAMSPLRIAQETAERMTPSVVLSPTDAEKVEPIIAAQGDGFLEAFAKSTGSAFIETVSERSGAAIEKLTGPLKRIVMGRWLAKNPEAGVKGFVDTLEKFGWHGPINEMLEERVGEGLRAATGIQDYVPPTAEQIAAELIAFSIPGAPGAVAGAVDRWTAPPKEQTDAIRALARAQMLKVAGETIQDTEIGQKSPGATEDLLSNLAADGPAQTFYQSADTWKEYFESKGLDPEEVAGSVLGDAQAYKDALESGSDFAIPASRYFSAISPSEHAKFFQDEIRVGDPGEMNAREAKEIMAQTREAAKAVEAKPAAEPTQFEQETAQVEARVTEMLQAVGRPKREAVAQAKVYAERAARRAGIRGETPLQVFESLGLSIQGTRKARVATKVTQLRPPTEAGPVAAAAQPAPAPVVEGFTRPSEEEIAGAEKIQEVFGSAYSSPRAFKSALNFEAREKIGTTHNYHKASFILPHGDMLVSGAKLTPEEQLGAGAIEVLNDGKEISAGFLPTFFQIQAAVVSHNTFNPGQPLLVTVKDAAGNVVKQTTVAAPTQENVLAAFKTAELFQEGKRGSFSFGPEGMNINLFKDMDRSTFLHETGHLWMREIQIDEAFIRKIDPAKLAPEQKAFLKDVDTLKDWLGAESLQDLTESQQEGFARGAEAYFLEGKAPSASLKSAFARFRAWLVRIYRSIKQLNVVLTDDVRGVMDRLLATEEEIAAVRAEQSQSPLFATPKAVGMTDAAAAEYVAATEEAREAAEEALLGPMMKKLRDEKTPAYLEAEARIRQEAAAELQAQPIYRALAALQHGTRPDGTKLPEGTLPAGVDFKISRVDALPLVGKSTLDVIDTRYTPKIMAGSIGTFPSEVGIHPDIVAQAFGFSSGKDLLNAAAKTIRYETALKRLTTERMQLAYPDFFEEPTKEDAIRAIHNRKQSKVIQLEIEHLASQAQPTLKGIVRVLAKPVATKKAVEVARTEARKIIDRQNVGEIHPYVYRQAEKRAAAAAAKAFAKADFNVALQAKLHELANHELFMAATEARLSVRESIRDFQKFNRSDETLSESRDVNLVNAARAILVRFGIGSYTLEKTAEGYLDQLKKYDEDAYATISGLVEAATGAARDYRSVPYSDFDLMREAVEALWTQSRRVRQIEIDKELLDRDQLVTKLTERIHGFTPLGKKSYEKAKGFWQGMKGKLVGLRAHLTRAEAWAAAMDAGDPGRLFQRSIYTPVSEAATQARAAYGEELAKLREIVKPLEGTLFNGEIEARELDGFVFENRAELIGALLHTGNESNMAKLLRGYGWGEYNDDGTLNTSKWDKFIQRMIAEGTLTKADFDVVQAVWDQMDKLLPKAQAAHKKIYGFYFGEIEKKPIQTPWGTYAGGYAPAVVDYAREPDAKVHPDTDVLENGQNSFLFASTGRGFSRRRVEGYARPLKLDFSLITSHLEKVTRFIHLQPVVKDINRLFWDYRFSDALKKLDGEVRTEMLFPWLQRAAMQRVIEPTKGWEGSRVWSAIRRRAGMNTMFGNVVNTLQQYSGLSLSAIAVKPKHLRNALATYLSGPRAAADAMYEKSDFMKTLQVTQVMEVQKEVQDLFTQPTAYAKAKDFAEKHAYIFQVFTQGHINTITWMGAYEQAIEFGESEPESVRLADSAVRRTQGSFNAEDLSKFEAGSPFGRMFTMFYSYYNMMLNLLGSEFITVMRTTGLKKGYGRLLYVYSMGFAVPAIMSEAIRRALIASPPDDKDDDEYLNDTLAAVFVPQARGAVSLLPFGQIGLSFFDMFKPGHAYYDDHISVSPVVGQIEATGRAIAAVTGDKPLGGRNVRDIMTAIGFLSGIPVGQLGRPIGYVVDVESGKIKPESPADLGRGLLIGR